MGLTLVTAPTAEPVSLAEAKAHLRVLQSAEDALIASYLMAARESAETYTRRALAPQTWDLTIDYDWPTVRRQHDGLIIPRIVLPKPPLTSVTSITYVDTAGASQTLAGSQYLVDARGIEGVIEPTYNVTWPSVREQRAAITVRFVTGYTQIPEAVRAAILLTLGHLYEHREDVVVGPSANELPRGAEALLFPYRVFY